MCFLCDNLRSKTGFEKQNPGVQMEPIRQYFHQNYYIRFSFSYLLHLTSFLRLEHLKRNLTLCIGSEKMAKRLIFIFLNCMCQKQTWKQSMSAFMFVQLAPPFVQYLGLPGVSLEKSCSIFKLCPISWAIVQIII